MRWGKNENEWVSDIFHWIYDDITRKWEAPDKSALFKWKNKKRKKERDQTSFIKHSLPIEWKANDNDTKKTER